MEHGIENRAMSRRALFWRGLASDLAVMTVIGVFLALIGPFGSIDQPLAVRLLYWLAFAYVGYAIYRPMGALVDRVHETLALPVAPLWFAAVLIATFPMAALVHAVQYMPGWPPMLPLEDAVVHYGSVFVIGGAVTLVFQLLGARGAQAARPPASPPATPAPEAPSAPSPATMTAPNPLIDALPPELGSDVIALEMEDHYVRVHTALGSEMVLMRLRDAMAHVAEIEGRQVHRSWWVARGAVEDVRREGRNVRLVLARGIEAPVARAQVSELRSAGWI